MVKLFSIYTFVLAANLATADKIISSITQLSPAEKQVVDWIKAWTVPNTRNGDGDPWSTKRLPRELTSWAGYDENIKPAAWAAGIVTSFSLSEQILQCGNFYAAQAPLIDQRCDACFKYPTKPPSRNTFPIEVFTYSFCQGEASNPDTKTGRYGPQCDCHCYGCPGKLIGPNQKCSGKAWQNGLFGMEQNNVISAQDLANKAEHIYHSIGRKDFTYIDVLENTLTVAGFPTGTYEYENVMRCFPVDRRGKRQKVEAKNLSWACADVVSMWLVRNHLVGLSVGITDNLTYKWNSRLNMVKVFAKYFNI